MLKPALYGLAALALVASPSLAQPARPAAKAPARGAAAAPATPTPPPIFPCRTTEEVCFLGIVTTGKLAVLFTNAPSAEGIEEKPIDVMGADGSKIDMSKNEGRVVMLTGTYDSKAGLSKAEVVEVASPLASLIVKAQLAGGGPEGAAPGPKAPARRR